MLSPNSVGQEALTFSMKIEQNSKPPYSPTDWHKKCWNKVLEVHPKVNLSQRDHNIPK